MRHLKIEKIFHSNSSSVRQKRKRIFVGENSKKKYTLWHIVIFINVNKLACQCVLSVGRGERSKNNHYTVISCSCELLCDSLIHSSSIKGSLTYIPTPSFPPKANIFIINHLILLKSPLSPACVTI